MTGHILRVTVDLDDPEALDSAVDSATDEAQGRAPGDYPCDIDYEGDGFVAVCVTAERAS